MKLIRMPDYLINKLIDPIPMQPDEECSVYFEDLKSEDNNIKINAISRLSTISKLIGFEKTKKVLLPFIIEVIEDQDNDEEVLVMLAL